MLAVIAASTRIHSRPSRNTKTPMSRKATVGLVFGCVGSGAPCAVTPCHMIRTTTQAAATIMPVRNASFIELESYHIGLRLLPFDCFFLAASCAMPRGSPWVDYWTQTIVELRNDLVSSRELNEALIDTFLGYCRSKLVDTDYRIHRRSCSCG